MLEFSATVSSRGSGNSGQSGGPPGEKEVMDHDRSCATKK
jgi:hypothetical protein